jgi:serine/threonine protein kinase
MLRVQLPLAEWFYDPNRRLGAKGGFGEVYLGKSSSGAEVAVKKLYLDAAEAAHREMEIAVQLAGRQFNHVMSVFDAGLDAASDSYFVVMPRAVNSLQDAIDDIGPFSDLDSSRVLLEITNGLIEVSDLVHRDLKPGNILFHDSKWKIADFGIARFVEDSTSLRTLKECLSPQYAAPEQWMLERATQSTDVYALGCIGYALLTGTPPFDGKDMVALREQHLGTEPKRLNGIRPQLQSFLTMVLRKAPASRPTIARVREILADIIERAESKKNGSQAPRIAEVGAALAQQEAEREALEQRNKSESNVHWQLVKGASRQLEQLSEDLRKEIKILAPTANLLTDSVELGLGRLEFESRRDNTSVQYTFKGTNWRVIFDSRIRVQQKQPKYEWSSSLWYMRPPDRDEYRWYEMSYFALIGAVSDQPFSLSVTEAIEVGGAIGKYQVAFGPCPIDDESQGKFRERWMLLLSQAAEGKLRHPGSLPLAPNFWNGAS